MDSLKKCRIDLHQFGTMSYFRQCHHMISIHTGKPVKYPRRNKYLFLLNHLYSVAYEILTEIIRKFQKKHLFSQPTIYYIPCDDFVKSKKYVIYSSSSTKATKYNVSKKWAATKTAQKSCRGP